MEDPENASRGLRPCREPFSIRDPIDRVWWPCVVRVAIRRCGCSERNPVCQGDLVLGDVQLPTPWLPIGLTAAVVVGAAVWPGDRFTRVVVALCLTTLVIVGYFLLPSLFDVDQLVRG